MEIKVWGKSQRKRAMNLAIITEEGSVPQKRNKLKRQQNEKKY